MPQLTPITLDDGTVIFMEAVEDVNPPLIIELLHQKERQPAQLKA